MTNRTAFIKLGGTNSFLLHSLSSFQFGTHTASLHSNVSSLVHKITNLNDALKVFDEMSHRQPLPSVVKFNQLLTAVTKIKHFSSSLDLFKQMCFLGVPDSNYTLSITIKCCCQLHRTKDGFALLGCCFRRAISPNVI
ncbi:putative tetratricopeptide-like helical domain superfamily [Helianthus annuus]|nr:putative tetratricopeptide-like helical domain superfamily [Helianthus annuus]KAJ0756682.1 putative tetratricopeptide-like helical domain superfamily [Helianthus annuus]KAJ0760431.1 putative tetratricopeptide-like helical domain superfamily [Helianthus annuus]